MAKSAYIKKIFQSYKDGDWDQFNSVAQLIIEDERKKNHNLLADDLQKILQSCVSRKKAENNFSKSYFHLLPKDKDSNIPLIDIKETKLLLNNLVLTDDIKLILSEFIQEYERMDLLSAYGLTPSNRFLFCGPPGCGKTVTAQALAGELNLPILYTRFDSIISSYLGETASNLRQIFDFIEKGTWILFFDEFDAIAKSRDNKEEHGELKRVVNNFLQLLDNYDGDSIIIAATNHQQLLDTAIWRRFDQVIFFNKPEIDQIKELLQKNLKRYPTNIYNLYEMSEKLVGFSHADIERICILTIKRAIIEGKDKIYENDLSLQIELYRKRNNIYINFENTNQV